MFADHGFGVLAGLLKDRDVVFIALISNGDREAAEVSSPLGPLDGAVLEALIKLNGCQEQVVGRDGDRDLCLEG